LQFKPKFDIIRRDTHINIQTDQATSQGRTEPPVIPSGEEIYDMLMGEIEPDLVLRNVEELDEKYKDETPEQTKDRADRYRGAWKTYKEKLTEFTSKLSREVSNYTHEQIKIFEAEANEVDEKVLSEIEDMIEKAPTPKHAKK